MSKDPQKQAPLTDADKAAMAVAAKSATPPAPEAKPIHMRRWGGKEYPSDSFVRVTFLVTGSLSGERFTGGKSGDVPKVVFDGLMKPKRMAKLWEKPPVKVVPKRPGTDVGNFRRVK